jgi:stage II sporulation protein D
MLRRATVLCLLASALTPGTAAARFGGVEGFTPPALKGEPQFVVSGHGWGHGVGMSQWGAYGYAQKGFTYAQILAHYYPGTELRASTIKNIRVLLAETPSVTVSSAGPWKIKDGSTAATTMPAGKVTLNPQLKLRLPGATEPETFAGPLTFTGTAAAPLVFKKPYRGSFTVTSDGKKLTLVNTLPLEQYLYGVVPSEMPDDWLPEALAAQAVAARTYAIAVRKTTGLFDVYPDTRSQVYRGIDEEVPTTTAAVDATAGKVVTYGGKVANTYFFSTSGGRTAAIADVWNSQPIPYLVSVADPYDSISPYHDWGPFPYTAAKLKKALKAPGRLLDVQTSINPSGRVSAATAVGDNGELDLTGAQVQKALGLRSTWFRIGVLSLDPLPATVVPYGGTVTLTGLGRDLPGLRLEQRTAGTAEWALVRGIRAGADGTLSVPVKAAAPAEFRVTAGTVATPATKLLVAPTVTLKVAAGWQSIVGRVRPKLPGAAIRVQRLDEGTGKWTLLAKTTLAASGRYAVELPVSPGTYRARVTPGGSWATGVSAKVAAG